MWETIKQVTNSRKTSTLMYFIHKGRNINKPLEIANIANDYYLTKIIELMEKFKNSTIDPLFYINKLFKRNSNKFALPLLTVKETKN